jgi:glycosyltransferase involved in cell wall biosynthesis
VDGERNLGGPVALVSDTTEFAGAELYTTVLVEHLRDRAEFVALLGDGSAAETRARLAKAGAEVRIVPGLRRRSSPAALMRLVRALREVRPALVHVNLSDQGDGLAAVVAAVVTRRPVLATLHLVLPHRAGWREAISVRALRRFSVVIGVSEAVGRYLSRRGLRSVVVKNGLPEFSAARNPRDTLGLPAEGFIVGGVGRLHEQKGWDILCRAASLVQRERPDAVFAVIGDGPAAADLAAMAECQAVRFLGYRESAWSLIPAFDVLAVPSRYEGLGLTPLEALFHGVPVVASDIEGLAEVLGDCGVLVPANDPEALARGILRVASEPDFRADLVERGRRRARELFSADRMADETLAVYTAVSFSGRATGTTLQAMHLHSRPREGAEPE